VAAAAATASTKTAAAASGHRRDGDGPGRPLSHPLACVSGGQREGVTGAPKEGGAKMGIHTWPFTFSFLYKNKSLL
jgi:hypothetical protein